MSSPLSNALWYAEHGLAVFPLRPGLKVPVRGSHGLLEASLDPYRIQTWWVGLFATRNVGIATGGLVDVIDLDGPEGIATYEQSEDWPEIIGMVATPHGRHLYIRPTGERSRAAIFPGVDYRGQGGYVVAPPSVLASGEVYRWDSPLWTPAPPPERPGDPTMPTYPWSARRMSGQPAAETNGHTAPELFDPYVQAAIDQEGERLLTAPEGIRNDTLNTVAFNLGQLCPGSIPEGWLRAQLQAWGTVAGLTSTETAKTISSGLRAGMAKPRTVPLLPEPDVEVITDPHTSAVARELARLRISADAKSLLALESRPPKQPVRVATAAEVLADPPSPAARVTDLIGWAASTLVTAQRKTGKTTLMLNLSRSLLLGEPFLGRFPVRRLEGRVALLNFEVSAQQLARWALEAGLPLDRIITVNLRGGANPLTWAEDRAELAAKLRERSTEALLTDPFSRAFTGSDQNSAADVASFLAMLDQFCRSEVGALDLVLAAHAGWSGERTRGSSALEDWPDTIITMTKDEEDGQRYLRAMGRDVELEEDQLSYVETTRALTLAGVGSKAQAKAERKDLENETQILEAIGGLDGVGVNALARLLSELGIKIRKEDQGLAVKRLKAKGLIYEELGRNRAKILHRA